MVPSWNWVENIWLKPFLLVKIEESDVIVLHLGVPSTIDVDLVVVSKATVTTSSIWWTVDWDNLLPSFSLQIKGMKIIESDSLVAQTTMTSEDVDLVLMETSTCIGSCWWGSDRGFTIVEGRLVGSDSYPFEVLHIQEPGIVEPGLRTVMTTVDKDSIIVWRDRDGNVLSSC
jgi:hypothetical protein